MSMCSRRMRTRTSRRRRILRNPRALPASGTRIFSDGSSSSGSPTRRNGGPRMAKAAGAIALTLLLAACSSQARKAEAELATLAEWLPGRYDNVEQLRGDATRQPAVLRVVPFYAAPLGKAAFYLHETAADDPRRVLSQRIIAFDVDSEEKRI